MIFVIQRGSLPSLKEMAWTKQEKHLSHFTDKLSIKSALKGVVCNSNPIHFLPNISSRSASCPFRACAEKNPVFICSPGSVNGKQTERLRPSHAARTRAQDNSLDNSKFDRGIIRVYCEYSPLHLSPVSGSFITGQLSKSINIHCIQQVTCWLN